MANAGRTSLRWSVPMATTADAKAYVRDAIDAGTATLGFVVHVTGDGQKRIVATLPESARKIIGHYLDLLAALAAG